MSRLLIKDWSSFQHYKNRRPPWIKLHHTILDDFKFHSLPVASKAIAPMLWLLASESEDGSLANNPREIGFRLRMTEVEVNEALMPLVEAGFVIVWQAASSAIAGRKRDALLETEVETEVERDSEEEAERELREVPFDSDRLIKEILELHPKSELGHRANAAVIAAADDERQRQHITAREALEYLLARTRSYASAVANWPDGAAWAKSATTFFSEKIYRQDDAVWEKRNAKDAKADRNQQAIRAAAAAAVGGVGR